MAPLPGSRSTHFEERALLDALGEPYRRFAASRPRLFPGVW
jgi:protein-S-isoprenylcysteine O-methyltransferase Ste14